MEANLSISIIIPCKLPDNCKYTSNCTYLVKFRFNDAIKYIKYLLYQIILLEQSLSFDLNGCAPTSQCYYESF